MKDNIKVYEMQNAVRYAAWTLHHLGNFIWHLDNKE